VFELWQVGWMKEIALRLTKEWCDHAEESFMKDGTMFDPLYEMVKLTCQIICEAAFEYSISDDEYNIVLESLEDSLREVFTRQTRYGLCLVLCYPMFTKHQNHAQNYKTLQNLCCMHAVRIPINKPKTLS
jgi:hypothetical protein